MTIVRKTSSLIILGAAAMSFACATPSPQTTPSIDVVGHDSLVLASRHLGEARVINVHMPRGYDAAAGRRFPVLYMPDGGMAEDFPHIVRAVDSLTAAGAIPEMIVVGIPNTARRRDLTGPTRVASDSAIAPVVGGSAAFRAFIADELIPAIDARYRTTGERGMIGESLAGLFLVETALRRPGLFHRYAVFDPSLWWNKGALVDSTPALLKTSNAPTTLFIAVSRDGIDSLSSGFAQALRDRAPASLTWHFEEHPELTHATIFAGLEVKALAWMWR